MSSKSDAPTVLYISYDGMLEPLGQSQVVNYLEKLTPDYRIFLVSYEKPDDLDDSARFESTRARLRDAGITWRALKYHRKPSLPATAYDIFVGILFGLWLTRFRRVEIIHARSYVPAFLTLFLKSFKRSKFLFDMRGLWADERVDGGLWPPKSRIYLLAKRLERSFLLSADHVITLTQRSTKEIAGFSYLKGRLPPIDVIPTCVDTKLFRPRERDSRSGVLTLGYVGSANSWYRISEMMLFFSFVMKLRPESQVSIVNQGQHKVFQQAAGVAQIDPDRIFIVSADHRDVPDHICRMSVGAAIMRPVYSKLASAPTVLAEYLACGVPCIGTANVGDMGTILIDEKVGITIDDFSESACRTAAEQLLTLLDDPNLERRCVDTANRLFSLESGANAYRRVYDSLAAPASKNT